MSAPLVSVVVLTYNPSWPRLKPTLVSVLRQQNVSFELILSDDGSPDNLHHESQTLFQSHRFSSFLLLPSSENRGTVKNLLAALEKARGKYVYVLSPGDFFYDENTLSALSSFADEKSAALCFGESVSYYLAPGGGLVLPADRPLAPSRPALYNDPSLFRQKAAFFFLDYILGAAYFRRADTLRKYLHRIEPFVKYAEDTPSTLFALADGVPLYYFPAPVVFYDCGSGISSRRESRWSRVLAAEYRAAYDVLLHDYPGDRVLRCAWRYRYDKHESEPVWRQVLVDPAVVWAFYRRRRVPVRLNDASEENRRRLVDFLNDREVLP